ncbi:MAG TPA: HDOD domain-containing protein [Phycisphaerae bacterium]|nr:HDOD domain-containing protein [Phycisphaerae bacterium]HRY67397.1 HDOD domain-containing protein [Phycisphaerae bacterium]HSA29846.1 HDOD domain-containing protein [Phycisphaerae bacterium]
MGLTATETKGGMLGQPGSQVELILAQIESLPTLPAVAVQLLELSSNERASIRDLVRIVESDPSLAARIVSLVRRADKAAHAETVERAVVLLGFDAVRNLALSIQIFETFSHRVESGSRRFDRLAFWKHCLAVGCAARLLSEKRWATRGVGGSGDVPNPEQAFICGLLHDLGKVVLAACFPKTYDRVVEKSDALLGGLIDVERELFGLDHTLAGRRLATYWKLPTMIEECVWLHHHLPASTPTKIGFPSHVRLVQMADELVRHVRIGYSGNYQVSRSLWSAFGVPSDIQAELGALKTDLIELVESRVGLMGLDSLTSQEVYEEALGKANQELAQVNSRLSELNGRLAQRSQCFEALQEFKSALGEEPDHEHISRAVLAATRVSLPTVPAAAVAWSPCRSLVVIAVAPRQPAEVYTDLMPDDLAAGTLADRGPTAQDPEQLLSRALIDRLMPLLGAPPGWCQTIRRQGRLLGCIVLAEAPPSSTMETLTVLADWAGSWLYGAESRMTASRLSEEMSDMNRRLVESQAEVTRMRSLAMVGEMAAGAAHEINNPLAVISGRAQLLHRNAQDDQTRRVADLIAEHAHKASAIVNELMEFAKPEPPQPTTWPVARLLSELRAEWLTKASLNDEQFRLVLSDDLPDVHADAAQVRKLFDELVRNAVEAMQDHPKPLLVINCRANVADEMVVVKVEDSGVGMAPEVLERATDPFFSSRTAGRGRGLGLSRAARYAEINGGQIRLSSRPREGTVVLVTLPTARKP